MLTDLYSIPSPCYVLEENKLEHNLKILDQVQQKSGAKILVALKGFAFWQSFGLVSQYLHGSTASGIYEARLGYETLGGREQAKEVCVFSPAYKKEEILELLPIATHIIFNSFHQWQTFKPLIDEHNATHSNQHIQVGLRLNPLYSEVTPEIYNPCAPKSRLGITPQAFQQGIEQYGLDGISGLHFHTHCEQNSDALERTLPHIFKHFSNYLSQMKWINLGGGHHITRKDYDLSLLISLIGMLKERFPNLDDIFLEPGEAVGWQCGYLMGEVIDIIENEGKIAILDVSATAHMPDCLEMPYRPNLSKLSKGILEADQGENNAPFRYRLGGPTCLSGDVIGDYSFHSPLEIGDRIFFEDMIHYTIVKNNTFNGVPLPSLGMIQKNGDFKLLKTFNYHHYKDRNG
ncbi:carboxynorspermidine decarboxylase [Helicobacter kayseriensis]|uniref:carboxynorspermidine decarboxylase n=1 Tax=Helicobacter kayseriensis TaxID=2905877 RepID=UPI001E46B3E6|nr:carboxynorspermidine decarboxylase [Helicobacter kayseriensis]MCE3047518.1 carboxynorspermidine decarboxylase [Helicobacter kayseriensis]MCE3048840.1 carboxynorspermidine decarboxylase [Helicobacter kayseriensis]